MTKQDRICLGCQKVVLTKQELEEKDGLCFFCLINRTLEMRKLTGNAAIPLCSPEECGRDSLDLEIREAIQIANNTSIDEFDDDDVDSQEDEVIDEAAIKEQISSILDNASTSCDTSPPKEAPAELTESKPLSIAERREIYEKTGMDPCSIFVEPRVLRVFGGSPEVKLELTLPLISKDSEGKDFEPQYMEVLQRTLDFINHINVFGKYHPSTLPQLAQFLKGPNDPGSFPG